MVIIQNVADNKMLFADDVVKIEPPEGDIWPNSSAEITIVFRPDKAETYNRTAFCDITGRETRLPLKVTGVGIGPKVSVCLVVPGMRYVEFTCICN